MNDDNEETFEVTLVPIDDDQAPGGSDETTIHVEEKGTFGDEFAELNPIKDLISRVFWTHDCVTGGLTLGDEFEEVIPITDRVTRAKWEQFLIVRDCADVTIH